MSVALWLLGTRHFNRIREAAALPWFDGVQEQPTANPVRPDRLEGIVAQGQPWLLTLIGFGGLAIILSLMRFKPFL